MSSSFQPFLSTGFVSGLRKDVRPFLLDEAFPELTNAYIWRKRLVKKGGNKFLGRLGLRTIKIAQRTAGADTYVLNLPFAPIEPGSLSISDGVTFFSDDGLGNFVITPLGNGTQNAPINYATGAINITFNVGNLGANVIALYTSLVGPNSPVMGLLTYELPNTVDEALVAFDLTTSYQFNTTANIFINILFYKGTGNSILWTGTNYNFFWGTNYQGALFATNNVPGANFYVITNITNAASAIITIGPHNFVNGDTVYINNVIGMTQINGLTGTVTAIGVNTITVNINSAAFGVYISGGIAWSLTKTKANSGDGIRWYDGTGWVNFAPPLDVTGTPQILQGCLMMFTYHDHLVCLNTNEGTTLGTVQNYPQRARYSQNGNVFYAVPLPANNNSIPVGNEWYQTPGVGGFIDATTNESIIGAALIKDVLVVYFDSSTWKLVFTGNQVLPFLWERINSEVGCQSTFSVVPFDQHALDVGSNGIFQCNSVDMDRIDRIIPDEVFDFRNANNGQQRVYGIRDFYSEMAYWTYGSSAPSLSVSPFSPRVFPDRILAYNYVDGTWSTFYTSYTCFGHFQTDTNLTWGNAVNPWQTYNASWSTFENQVAFPSVVAGNQTGVVFFSRETDESYPPQNDPSLFIYGITNAVPSVFNIPNHNLSSTVNQLIKITDVKGAIALNGNTYLVDQVIDENNVTLLDFTGNSVSNVAGYTYGGFCTLVDNFVVTTKALNPFYERGENVRIGYVDCYFDNTDIENPEAITVKIFIDDDLVDASEYNTVILTNPNNVNADRFWTRIYFNSQGSFIYVQFTYSSNPSPNLATAGQIFNLSPTQQLFVLNAITVWLSQAGRIVI